MRTILFSHIYKAVIFHTVLISLFMLFSSKLFAEFEEEKEPVVIPNIVGGSEVTPGSRSYQAMLLFNGQQGCGGTLIEDFWVITAAHCLDNANTNTLTVRLGAHYRNSGGTTHRVTQIIRHPNWGGGGGIANGYDIGLLKLATPAAANLKRAKLPTQAIQNELAAPGRYLTVSGWGRTYNGGPASNVLLEVNLPVLSTQQCQQQLSPSINGTVICGGGPNNTSACNGDSGGPFVAQKNGTFYSMGTVSWGRSCRGATAFTRTLSYVNWIKNFVDIDDGNGGGNNESELVNGVPVSVSGNTGSEKLFTINVPNGSRNLVITTSGGSGDADLFVRRGQKPTTSNFDCRPYLNGNQETCRFSQASGTYHVMIRGWREYNNVSLRASYENGDGGGNGGNQPINSILRNINVQERTWKRYVFELPSGYSQLQFSISGGDGEVDMYINFGSASSWSDYDCRPAKYGNNETCTFSSPQAGRWYIDLYGFYNSRGLTLTTKAN
ncbi:MAG: trypsin-like serine protease [Gammaproteobacteria bacterium]|nr:trypsin-like serine protease [Gammaproteobacteria bacterium]